MPQRHDGDHRPHVNSLDCWKNPALPTNAQPRSEGRWTPEKATTAAAGESRTYNLLVILRGAAPVGKESEGMHAYFSMDMNRAFNPSARAGWAKMPSLGGGVGKFAHHGILATTQNTARNAAQRHQFLILHK